MMAMTLSRQDPQFAEIDVRGKLTRADYEALLPQLEEAIDQHGKLRVLIKLDDFHGWTPSALADELRFDIRHRNAFDRIAIVGDSTLEKLGTKLSAPFFSGETRYFENEASAREWVA